MARSRVVAQAARVSPEKGREIPAPGQSRHDPQRLHRGPRRSRHRGALRAAAWGLGERHRRRAELLGAVADRGPRGARGHDGQPGIWERQGLRVSRLAEQVERYDGLGLAELIRTKEVTLDEVLAATLERIDARNPAINAIVTRMDDQARAAIRAGLPEGPFRGVPYLLKDLGALYTGVVTSFGNTLFAGFAPDHDSEIVARMKRAGLVIAGKTNTPEMGISPSTEPRLFGPTKNPWKSTHSAGGSSGGAAAAVAAGIAPMAHATDGGGSIRIPASACGLFGLKPTRARNPAGPDAGEGWSGASIGHAVTWTVRDSAALLDATSGPDVGDPYWAPPPARPFLQEVGRDPGPLRIAVTTTPWIQGPVDAECAEAARGAAKLCESLGHHNIEEARPQIDEAAWQRSTAVI